MLIGMSTEKVHKETTQPIHPTLRQCVEQSVNDYLSLLDGHEPTNLYDLVLAEVERPLVEVVMLYTRGNISKAAQLLGLNRSTLRKKIKLYSLDLTNYEN